MLRSRFPVPPFPVDVVTPVMIVPSLPLPTATFLPHATTQFVFGVIVYPILASV